MINVTIREPNPDDKETFLSAMQRSHYIALGLERLLLHKNLMITFNVIRSQIKKAF